MRGSDIAAWRQCVDQWLDDPPHLVLGREEMQHRDEHQRDRLGEVQCVPGHRVGENLLRFARVRIDVYGPALRLAHQQRAAMREHDRVVVHVYDTRGRVGRLRDLVDVTHAGQSRADVEELRDARVGGQVPDGAAEERPVLPRRRPHRRPRQQRLVSRLPVSGKVVLAAEEVVVHPGRVRLGHIDLRGKATIVHDRYLTAATPG